MIMFFYVLHPYHEVGSTKFASCDQALFAQVLIDER